MPRPLSAPTPPEPWVSDARAIADRSRIAASGCAVRSHPLHRVPVLVPSHASPFPPPVPTHRARRRFTVLGTLAGLAALAMLILVLAVRRWTNP